MYTDPTTGEQHNGVAKLSWSHKAMVRAIAANPNIRQWELAVMFDRSESWISQIKNSDAFQAELALYLKENEDPFVLQTMEDRYKTLASRSLELLQERVEQMGPLVAAKGGHADEFLLKTAELATKALGYGQAKPGAATNIAVVVQVPAKQSADDWVRTHSAQVLNPS